MWSDGENFILATYIDGNEDKARRKQKTNKALNLMTIAEKREWT
jgi:hypothetical protein